MIVSVQIADLFSVVDALHTKIFSNSDVKNRHFYVFENVG
jgi:hypothetical protein